MAKLRSIDRRRDESPDQVRRCLADLQAEAEAGKIHGIAVAYVTADGNDQTRWAWGRLGNTVTLVGALNTLIWRLLAYLDGLEPPGEDRT